MFGMLARTLQIKSVGADNPLLPQLHPLLPINRDFVPRG
jgi:hypothetical protein